MSLVGPDGRPLKGISAGVDPAEKLAARQAQEAFITGFKATGDCLLVRLMDREQEIENQRDADGPKLYLPDTFVEAENDALVLVAGPGLRVRDDAGVWHECLVWADVGDRVLFEKHKIDFLPQSVDEKRLGLPRLGVVHDSDVAAYLRKPHHRYVEPANGWIKIQPDERDVQTPGMVRLVAPEEIQQRPDSGVVLDFGPGRIRVTGPRAGRRRSILEHWGLSSKEQLRGHRIYWTPETEVVQQTGDADELETFLINVFPDEEGLQINTPYALSEDVIDLPTDEEPSDE